MVALLPDPPDGTPERNATMARKISFVPTLAAPSSRQLNIDDIPQEIKDEVEQVYAALKENPNGRFRAEFDSKTELLQYIAQASSYCAQRPAGAVKFRRSPTRDLPETTMDYRVVDIVDNGTETVREAVEAVKAVAPVTETVTPPKSRSRR